MNNENGSVGADNVTAQPSEREPKERVQNGAAAESPKDDSRKRGKKRADRDKRRKHAEKKAGGGRRKRLLMGKHIRRVLIAAMALIFAAACCCLLLTATGKDIVVDEVTKYYHEFDVDSAYEMRLKPNELYPDAVLGEGRVYAKSLMDRLNISFNARYKGSAPAVVTAQYAIEAVVSAYQGNGETRRLVYSRAFPIMHDAPRSDTGSADIERKVSLDLATYTAFADEAELILAAAPAREITVIFSGSFHAETSFGALDEPFTYTYTLNTDNSLFTIAKPDAIHKAESVTETIETVVYPETWDLVPCILLLSLTALALLASIFATRGPDAQEEGVMYIQRLQRAHASRLVKLSAPLPEAEVETIYVADMDSLVKISDEVQRSICYYPDGRGLPADGCLCIPHDKRRYILMLKQYTPLEVEVLPPDSTAC